MCGLWSTYDKKGFYCAGKNMLIIYVPQIKKQNAVPVIEYRKRIWKMPY